MPHGISGLFLLTNKGESLISRIFRDDISLDCAHTFRLSVISSKDIRSPINRTRDATFLHIYVGELYVMAATKGNPNCSVVFELLHSIVVTFQDFFGEFSEEAIRKNSAVIYELLDEMLDFGYPQITQTESLKLFIKGQGEKSETAHKQITKELTGKSKYRQDNIIYKKNEIFIDVIENINALISKEGKPLSQDVSGQIKLKCILSGMPECRFGFNDKLQIQSDEKMLNREINKKGIAIDDVTCHPCVKLNEFDKNREIQFTPPDGVFELLNYRTTANLQLPFNITPIVNEYGNTRVDYKIRIESTYSQRLTGTDVKITIPTPPNTALTKIKTQAGKAKYEPSLNAIVWLIKKFPGNQHYDFTAHVDLISTTVKKVWSRPPISLSFEVPTCASGLVVRYLRVVEHKLRYTPLKWVRYIARAGNYQFRIS
eukprot:TRINITY_DN3536_c0_g1_i1.p1 TRINITY_DN3536_c0_g1~~TRINITY_DN3536_c0_g1_i1.p1  ORF type:complete len:429 (-),score=108.02 TRINITY_DN3536_c0_g1_i1:78-1364(-)